jgi:hypothetical protein
MNNRMKRQWKEDIGYGEKVSVLKGAQLKALIEIEHVEEVEMQEDIGCGDKFSDH